MKKQFKLAVMVFNSILCIIQSFVLANIPKEINSINLYLGVSITFVLLINLTPYLISKVVEIDPKGVFTPNSFHNSFVPLVIELNKRAMTHETINEIQLLYDWRKAARTANLYSRLEIINEKTVSYDENKIYAQEFNCIINVLLRIYEQCEGFANVVKIYKCCTMQNDVKKLYDELKRIKK